MMNTRTMTVLLGLLLGCARLACGATAPADAAALEAAGKTLNAAYQALDAGALATQFADDAVLMPEAAAAQSGRAAIGTFFRAYFTLVRDGGYQPALSDRVTVEVAGDFGLRSGTYVVRDKSGRVTDTGKWLEVWRKADGRWRVARQIWNSDVLPLFDPVALKAALAAAAGG